MTLHFSRTRVFDGTRFLDGPHDVLVEGGRVAQMSEMPVRGEPDRVGGVLFPGFGDAHVHLSFWSPEEVARRGVTTVLDLGAPMSYATDEHPPLRFRFAGPLFTAPGGYPTRSWGAGGYGLEVRDEREATDAVGALVDAGAAMIKIAIEQREGPLLEPGVMRAIVERAHSLDLLVAAHALEASSVRLALDAGVDVLAHTPVGKLDDDIVHACGDRKLWVISTIRAFDAKRALKNLTALSNAGCRVAYGTDLGNGQIAPGIDAVEMAAISRVLGDEGALRAACADAGELAGTGGRIALGLPADLLWLPALGQLSDLAGSNDVWIDGMMVT